MGTGSDDGAREDFPCTAANDNSGSEAGAGGGPEARIEAAGEIGASGGAEGLLAGSFCAIRTARQAAAGSAACRRPLRQ